MTCIFIVWEYKYSKLIIKFEVIYFILCIRLLPRQELDAVVITTYFEASKFKVNALYIILFFTYSMVTSITFKTPVALDRQEYENIEDLLQHLFHLRNDSVAVDFHEIDASTLSQEVIEKIEASKQKDVSAFTSISS